MTARVHIITLITGEYDGVSRQVVGAYLDYSKAAARAAEVGELIEKHGLTREAIKAKLASDDGYFEPEAEIAFAKALGVDFVYVSYTGLFVDLSSYYLNG